MTQSPPLPVIGLVSCVREVGIHPFHIVGEKYVFVIARACQAMPLLIPALGSEIDIDDLLRRLDGVFFPGSPSMVAPHHYGGAPSRPGTHHDPQRDETTLPLIRRAIERGVPLLAICRGFQELNVALGGTLHEFVQDVPGMMDHREDKSQPREAQYAPAHGLELVPDGRLAELAGGAAADVNSLHTQGIDRLGKRLVVEARAPDGLIEAARVADAANFALGLQWHPEYQWHSAYGGAKAKDPFSVAIFRAFADAARARAAARRVTFTDEVA
ncbi:MAG: gamma-glutamyl-gamma-aminobutyrate hydrolase family protein [Alphaproteobacteria bacterium]